MVAATGLQVHTHVARVAVNRVVEAGVVGHVLSLAMAIPVAGSGSVQVAVGEGVLLGVGGRSDVFAIRRGDCQVVFALVALRWPWCLPTRGR